MKKTLILRNFGLADRNPTKYDGSDWSDSRFFVWREGGSSCSTHPSLDKVKPRRTDTYAIDCEAWGVYTYHQRQWILIGDSSRFYEAWKTFRQDNTTYACLATLRRSMIKFPHFFRTSATAELEAMERSCPAPVYPPFQVRIDFELP